MYFSTSGQETKETWWDLNWTPDLDEYQRATSYKGVVMSLLIAGSEVQGLLPRYCYRQSAPVETYKGALVPHYLPGTLINLGWNLRQSDDTYSDRTAWIICERTYQESQAGTADSTYSTITSALELLVWTEWCSIISSVLFRTNTFVNCIYVISFCRGDYVVRNMTCDNVCTDERICNAQIFHIYIRNEHEMVDNLLLLLSLVVLQKLG